MVNFYSNLRGKTGSNRAVRDMIKAIQQVNDATSIDALNTRA